MAIQHTFSVYERLKRVQHIDTLFRTGKAFSVFPVKVVYMPVARSAGERAPMRVGFSVPKKKFKHAVKRNRVRRLMREAWRLSKHEVYPHIADGQQVLAFFIYLDKKIPAFAEMQKCFGKLNTHLTPHLMSQSPSHE